MRRMIVCIVCIVCDSLIHLVLVLVSYGCEIAIDGRRLCAANRVVWVWTTLKKTVFLTKHKSQSGFIRGIMRQKSLLVVEKNEKEVLPYKCLTKKLSHSTRHGSNFSRRVKTQSTRLFDI